MDLLLATLIVAALTLLAAGFGVWYAKRGAMAAEKQLELATTDVYIVVRALDPAGNLLKGGTFPEGDPLQLVAMNLGGSTSKPGKLVITVFPQLTLEPPSDWSQARPNALAPPSSMAWSCPIPPIVSNGRFELPPLDNLRGTQGGSRIRWEVWIDDRGANSDDLVVSVDG